MRRIAAALVLALLLPATAYAKSYTAERFDSRIEVLPGGSLRIVETIVIRFEEGTFTFFFRTLPTRRTDGIEFVSASMDGRVLPSGDDPGHVEVRRKNGLRVDWHFAPTPPSRHTFQLTYVARGVAFSERGHDVVAWRALPGDHAYRIESSRVDLILPSPTLGAPRIERRRVDSVQHTQSDGGIVINAAGIARNGWLEIRAPFATGTVVSEPPDWHRRQLRQAEFLMPSAIAAALVLAAGLIVLFAVHQQYEGPPADVQTAGSFAGPPDSAPPVIAGALTSNGRLKLEHAMGTLFALAAEEVLTVHEQARGALGTRKFVVVRGRSRRPLLAHEQALVDRIFSAKGASTHEVPLEKARSQLARHFSKFKRVVEQEMREAGLLDADRERVRRRYNMIGVFLVVLCGISMIPFALLVDRIGSWPVLVPATFMALAIVSFILAAAHTSLSNDGVRRAAVWRAYRKQLRRVPKDLRSRGWMRDARSPSELLPLAVALGLAASWSKIFKDAAAPLPPWFHAASASDAHRGFVAFVGHGGAGASGTGSGAAGGGGSGAG